MPWLALALASATGLALTAGWTLRVAWSLIRDTCGRATDE